jgi:MSHA biogenesis protein MshL
MTIRLSWRLATAWLCIATAAAQGTASAQGTATAQGTASAQSSAPAASDEPRFDLDVTDAPARAFFDGLVNGTRYNIVLEPGDTVPITLKLKNITVPEVLDAVRDAYGYDYRPMATGFLIIPPSLQTRLYQINYIDMERRGTSRMRVASGQVGQSSNSGVQGTQQSPDTQQTGLSEPPGPVFGDGGAGGRGGQVKEITGTSISTRSSSDFWRDLEANLHAMIGTEAGRSVIINDASGIIAVRATPRELREVTQFLDKLQRVATRQVVLEAKIVEVQLSNAFQAGINWAAIGKNGSQTYSGFLTGPQNGFGTSSNLNLLNQPSNAVTVGPGNPITSTVTNTLGGAFSLAVDTADFSTYIELLNTQGKARVLSSPRVSTLNNQKAVIKAGSDQYFVTGISSNTLVGTASATNLNVDLAPFFSGVALDVTPQISELGEVILHIHPTVSQVTANVQALTVSNQTDSLPLALSQIRESDSIVKAQSGQLIVIGGLMQSTRTSQDYAMPGLGELPLLGNLFKSQQKTDVRSELVILLRAIVIESDAQWNGLTGEPPDPWAHKPMIGSR